MNRIVELFPADTDRARLWCRCCGRPHTAAAPRRIVQEAGAAASVGLTKDRCEACGAPETAAALPPRYVFGAGI